MFELRKDVLENMPDAQAFSSDASIDFLLPTRDSTEFFEFFV